MDPLSVKRAYEAPADTDGIRILVDRIWPRGVSKATLKLDAWIRAIAPSDALRKWFGHDPQRWDEFRRRYFDELDAHPEAVAELLSRVAAGPATLVFGASDEKHNNAVALREYLATKGRR